MTMKTQKVQNHIKSSKHKYLKKQRVSSLKHHMTGENCECWRFKYTLNGVSDWPIMSFNYNADNESIESQDAYCAPGHYDDP